jgi:hypothetical protein
MVAGESNKEKTLRKPQHPDEELCAQAANDTEDNRVQEEPRFVAVFHYNFVPSFRAAKLQLYLLHDVHGGPR